MLRLLHGSSPRMRGKHAGQDYSSASARIIPAHAGQTQRVAPARRMGPDHPRACGANPQPAVVAHLPSGSSPRMRGKLLLCDIRKPRARIIPAHAGQTMTFRPIRRATPDHPRACGANVAANDMGDGVTGSSPRMRGKHGTIKHAADPDRIIPAHAGQTNGQ